MPQKLTNDEFLNRMKHIKPTIKILTEYINNKTKVLCKCLVDNYEWYATPRNLMQGKGCPKCGGTMKKTHNNFIEELQHINPKIEVLGNYVNNKTKIKCKCLIDGYEWSAIPNSLLQGHGCPICGGWIKKTHEEFVNELKIINPNIIVIDTYKNRKVKIKCKCAIDGNEWYAIPYNLLQGIGCPTCGLLSRIDSRTKSCEQFVSELKSINPNIEIIGDYINTYTKVKCRCKIDGCEWDALPNNLLQGHGCPQCNNNSRGENKIAIFLDRYNINYVPQKRFNDCKDKYTLPFDFYLSDYNICIEYDGEQHFKSKEYFGGQKHFDILKRHDNIKNEYCQSNKIKLLRISYWDFNNIESILANELGLNLRNNYVL